MQDSLLAKQATPIDITTPEQIADLVVGWHIDCMAQIDYIKSVPDDAVIKMTIDGVERALTPTERQIYLQGVATVAEVFKQLPFYTSGATDAEAAEDTGV
ncbi:hypothetical protein MIF8_68 [Erwinia phage MIF8]